MSDRAEELASVLSSVEWGATTLTQSFCPSCGGETGHGHDKDCKLANALNFHDLGGDAPAEAATRENGDLLPCPFCGSEAIRSERLDEDIATHNEVTWKRVSCGGGCDIYFEIPDGYEAGTAAEQWNRRALSTHQQQGFPVVKVLGHIVNHMAWKDSALIVTVAHQRQGTESELLETLRACEYAGESGRCLWCDRDPDRGHREDCRVGEAVALAEKLCGAPQVADAGHPHLVGGEFQSDKYPTTPRGKVPLSVKDKTAQDLLWAYAQRRRSVDAQFSDDLEIALKSAGFAPPPLLRESTPGHGPHCNCEEC